MLNLGIEGLCILYLMEYYDNNIYMGDSPEKGTEKAIL